MTSARRVKSIAIVDHEPKKSMISLLPAEVSALCLGVTQDKHNHNIHDSVLLNAESIAPNVVSIASELRK
ncbi:MAG: hypothetical protein WB643_09225 [Candidatus Bathyarchaeia archaeon]